MYKVMKTKQTVVGYGLFGGGKEYVAYYGLFSS